MGKTKSAESMKNTWPDIKNYLLTPVHLDEQQLETALGKAVGPTIDAADLYLQHTQSENWFLEEGIVKEGGFNIDRGFGLRVMSGEKTGFAYADQITLPAMIEAAQAARRIVKTGGNAIVALPSQKNISALYPAENPLTSLTDIEKINLLKELDQFARSIDTRVKQVMINLSGEYDVMLMMNTQGVLCSDVRPLVHISIRVIVEEKGRIEQASAGCGGRGGYDVLLLHHPAKEQTKRAVHQALQNLRAVLAPAGTMPVVLGPGWPAVLLHEAIGHGLEGDFNRKKTSAFSGRLGERVASSLCTIVDDGTLPNRRGSLTVDDEGTPSQCTVLIENGILKNYLQDTLNARLMKMKPTGNGRRESYAHLPLPRMTNTYMLSGKHSPEEIISSVDKGIYAVDFAGGQVDITSGKFVFTTSEAYWIENGKVTRPIKGATLIGNGPDVLKKVSMVGNDLKLDPGVGTCGKAGQTVPVGVGQPTLKVDSMIVGGSQVQGA